MPYLIAIGGHVGTGKTCLAYGLRGVVPFLRDAVILEDDQIRRQVMGVALGVTMEPRAYENDISARVKDMIDQQTRAALAGGVSVVNPSGFFSLESRNQAKLWAAECAATFVGLWLVAPRQVMECRIRQRQHERETLQELRLENGHASDACVAVIDKFGELNPPDDSAWHVLDASLSIDRVCQAAAQKIG
ncbi:MAG: AAA family ATPase [Alphaproteobacteria bacterium]|nr:MAG: AAA family ATPase [Alphaproteobacteria bacterium]